MTSVVDTSVKFINSSQPGAPVLNGTAGSLISVLDALLVTGWGLQTATSLVIAGGVATMTFSSPFPAVVDSVILVAGSSIAALNGEQKVTAVGSGAVSFATAAADGSASGTITAKMAPAGWAKVFAGTNKAAYKSSDPTSNGMHLRIDDTDATVARVVGYEQMSDIDTGMGLFPSAAQQSGGGYWLKSVEATSVPTGYFIAADSRSLLSNICPFLYAGAEFVAGNTHGYGDLITSRASGDAFATILNYAIVNDGRYASNFGLDARSGASCAMPRDYTGLGGPVLRPRRPLSGSPDSTSGLDSTWGNFPSYIDGQMVLSKVAVVQASPGPVRGIIPGLFHVPQAGLGNSFSRGARVTGSGALAGRTLLAVNNVDGGASLSQGAGGRGVSFIDITGPWR